MNSNTRLIVNTLAQHVRSIVNIILSLYSTRLVLLALGQSDFGIFSLVGGVVSMLGFITNAMVVATQRHLSFYHGKGDMNEVNRIFSNSLLIHIIISIVISACIILLEPVLFDGLLKIDSSRIAESAVVYRLMIVSLIFTFIAAPYKALFFARENIVYISLVEISDGVLKLLCAIWLLQWQHDRLIAYSVIMAGIMGFNYLAFAIYAKIHFEESAFFPVRRFLDKKIIYNIFDIAGWMMYMMGCIIGRTQGFAIILNRFFGTVINASYGIAIQVSGATHFVAQAVTNAISPQIYKAEGMNNRKRMLMMSEAASKFSFLLMAMVVIPIVFEMDNILAVWLGDIPDRASMICQFVLVSALIDQSTTGLTIANLATGNIRCYSIVINTLKLLSIPLAVILLHWNPDVKTAMACYMGMEIISGLIRLPFLKSTAGLSITHYCKNVFLRLIAPTTTIIAASWVFVTYINMPFRFIFTLTISAIVSVPVTWYIGLLKSERNALLTIIGTRKIRILI